MAEWRGNYPLPWDGRVSVELSGPAAVRILGRDKPGAEVAAQLPGGDPGRYLEVRYEDRELHLELQGAAGELTLELRVPSGCRLQVENSNAALEVRDLEGTTELDTASGPVRLVGIRGELRADTGAGGLRLEGFSGRRLEVDSGSGEVQLLDVDAETVAVDSGSGSLTLDLARLRPGGRYRVDGGAGPVRVQLPPRASAVVVADSQPEWLQVPDGWLQRRGSDTYLLGNPGADAPELELQARRLQIIAAAQGSDPAPVPPAAGEGAFPEHPGREAEVARVLQLVASGRITSEEGAALLAALEGDPVAEPEGREGG